MNLIQLFESDNRLGTRSLRIIRVRPRKRRIAARRNADPAAGAARHGPLPSSGVRGRDCFSRRITPRDSGEDTFVDFERGLNVCIAQIRSALSDESTSPRFIRTVPRRGYQFIHPVEAIVVAAPPEPESELARREFPWRTSLATWLGLSWSLLLIVGFVQWRRNSQGASGPAVVAVVPFDNETGDASVNRFCSALTDNVIEQLTAASQNHYLVIGNASFSAFQRSGAIWPKSLSRCTPNS